jgi:hypothetical protein
MPPGWQPAETKATEAEAIQCRLAMLNRSLLGAGVGPAKVSGVLRSETFGNPAVVQTSAEAEAAATAQHRPPAPPPAPEPPLRSVTSSGRDHPAHRGCLANGLHH